MSDQPKLKMLSKSWQNIWVAPGAVQVDAPMQILQSLLDNSHFWLTWFISEAMFHLERKPRFVTHGMTVRCFERVRELAEKMAWRGDQLIRSEYILHWTDLFDFSEETSVMWAEQGPKIANHEHDVSSPLRKSVIDFIQPYMRSIGREPRVSEAAARMLIESEPGKFTLLGKDVSLRSDRLAKKVTKSGAKSFELGDSVSSRIPASALRSVILSDSKINKGNCKDLELYRFYFNELDVSLGSSDVQARVFERIQNSFHGVGAFEVILIEPDHMKSSLFIKELESFLNEHNLEGSIELSNSLMSAGVVRLDFLTSSCPSAVLIDCANQSSVDILFMREVSP